MSFLDGHTTGSTMTQIETHGDAGRNSQLEKASGKVNTSFDAQAVTESTINRQFNTSLGWVDNNGQEQESAASPTIPQKKFKQYNQTIW